MANDARKVYHRSFARHGPQHRLVAVTRRPSETRVRQNVDVGGYEGKKLPGAFQNTYVVVVLMLLRRTTRGRSDTFSLDA